MSSSNNVLTSLNPRTTSYEFLGPPGAFLITLGVPAITYALHFGCSDNSGGCPPPLSTLTGDRIIQSLSDPNFWKGLWDAQATLIYFAWYAFCVVAWFVLPGDWVLGVKLRTGERIKYKINGTLQMFCL
jgi:delta14-sterol reductase